MEPMPLAHISLSSLRAFEAVARLGSLTEAATELNVSISAVSHQLRELQDTLNVDLTAKRGRLAVLTERGAAFAHDLTLGFEHLNRGLRRAQERKDREVVALTVLPWFASRWLIPRLANFQRRYPQADVRIATTPQLMNLQREGFDGGIRYGRGHWPGHQAELLIPGRVSPLIHRSLIDRLGFPHHPAELARYPLLASTSAPDDWALWWNSAGAAGALPTASQIYDSREFVMHAALEGSGVGLVECNVLAAEIERGDLVKPFGSEIASDWSYYLVTPENSKPTKQFDDFRGWLFEESEESSLARTTVSTSESLRPPSI